MSGPAGAGRGLLPTIGPGAGGVSSLYPTATSMATAGVDNALANQLGTAATSGGIRSMIPGLFGDGEFGRPIVDGQVHHLFAPHLEKPAQIFFSFYFALTGIHALHMVVGVGIMLYIVWLARRNEFSPDYYNPVEIAGLYWHFVDIVWIIIFTVVYLIPTPAPAPV